MIEETVVVTLVSCARAGALMHVDAKVLLLDKSHGGARRAGGGDGRGMDGRRVRPPDAARLANLVCGSHGSVERSKMAHHGLVLLLLVGVDGLSMLPEVVKAGELLATMATKRALARVFPGRGQLARRVSERAVPDMTGKVLASGKNHATVAKTPALESLCRGWTVALCDARGLSGNKHGSHVRGI